jgi:hypothetical protein
MRVREQKHHTARPTRRQEQERKKNTKNTRAQRIRGYKNTEGENKADTRTLHHTARRQRHKGTC